MTCNLGCTVVVDSHVYGSAPAAVLLIETPLNTTLAMRQTSEKSYLRASMETQSGHQGPRSDFHPAIWLSHQNSTRSSVVSSWREWRSQIERKGYWSDQPFTSAMELHSLVTTWVSLPMYWQRQTSFEP